jgi:hypothetical protein
MLLEQYEWKPKVGFKLMKGKHKYSFKRGDAWLGQLENKEIKVRAIKVDASSKEALLGSKEDMVFFEDINVILVAPILKPNCEATKQNVIGALVAYSAREELSVLLTDKGKAYMEKIAAYVASFVYYNYICL